MNKVVINDVSYFVKDYNQTIFQFCFSKGIYIPCFCYHEKLSIAGNCRICLLEVNDSMVVSCAIPLAEEMIIFTDNLRVKHSREGIVEFLLVNHPLDCPICDQGGECDLQDIALFFGSDKGRFYEYSKRSVSNISFCGPLVKTVMTRCIHCTRCVRFLNEILGVFDLGVIGRGISMEIGTFIENHFDDALSANIVDLCPVGALTSMPYAFTTRPWELFNMESIDLLDGLASKVRVDVCNNKVMRILPSLDENTNEEWISNKARFIYDSFIFNRIDSPRIRIFSKLIVVSWFFSFRVFFYGLFYGFYKFFFGLCGSFLDLEGALAIKSFFSSLGCSNLNYEYNCNLSFDFRYSYLLNNTLTEIENVFVSFFLGLNLRLEAPLLSSRLRKSFLMNDSFLLAFSLGLSLDYLSFPVVNIGNYVLDFFKILEGKFFFFRLFFLEEFKNLKFLNYNFFLFDDFFCFLGDSILNRFDVGFFFDGFKFFFFKLFFDNALFFFRFFNVVSNFLGRSSCFEMGLLPGIRSFLEASSHSFIYLLGVDISVFHISAYNFIVYQGNFFNDVKNVSLFFPSSIFVEKQGNVLNIEGRLRKFVKVISSVVFSDSEILEVLFIFKNFFFKFFLLHSFFNEILDYSCFFLSVLNLYKNLLKSFFETFFFELFFFNFKTFFFSSGLLVRFIDNYYNFDIFSKNSRTMSLSALKFFSKNFSFYI